MLTMLHLWPRLRQIQAMRNALGVEDQHTNLNDLTTFAAILPEPLTPEDENDLDYYQPFYLFQPGPDPTAVPQAFLAEELMQGLNNTATGEAWRQRYPLLTYSERSSLYLLQQARGRLRPYLREVELEPPQPIPNLRPQQRITRRQMFGLGIDRAEALSRLILSNVVEPTRHDRLLPEDPLVRTDFYVVASLAEPLTSAIIWPILAELVASIGDRNLVNVIGLFATGSFANDPTRPIEEASVHISLMELEALQEINVGAGQRSPVDRLVADVGKTGWRARVGRQLFNRMYLLDREKSNQALARNPFELSVLAANAIESFVQADISQHLYQQIDDVLETETSLYSLLGAANSYVPLMQYIEAAIIEEQKRVARATLLAEPSADEWPWSDLSELGATIDASVSSLLRAGMTTIFEPEPNLKRLRRRMGLAWDYLWSGVQRILLRRPSKSSATASREENADPGLADLRVSLDYVFPAPVAAGLRRTSHMWRWRALAESQATAAYGQLEPELETSRFENAWGLYYFRPDSPGGLNASALGAHLQQFRQQTWAARNASDSRVLPSAIYKALRQTTLEIATRPDGLRRAKLRMDGWSKQVSSIVQSPHMQQMREQVEQWEASDQADYVEWRRDYLRVAGRQPHDAAIWVRALAGTGFATYIVLAWMLHVGPKSAGWPEWLAAVGVCLAPLVVLGFGPLLEAHGLTRSLKVRRMRLAQRRMSHEARRIVSESLQQVYTRLREDLDLLCRPLNAAVEGLSNWSQPEDPPAIPPAGLEPSHLRREFTNNEIWRQIKAQVQSQAAADGLSSQERFVTLWEEAGAEQHEWEVQGERLSQRVRLGLELSLNERELGGGVNQGILDLEVRRRLQTVQGANTPNLEQMRNTVRSDLAAGNWCGFADQNANAAQTPGLANVANTGAPTIGAAPLGVGGAGTPAPSPGARLFANSERRPSCTACYNRALYGCPFSEAGRDRCEEWNLTGIIRQYLQRATEHLMPRARPRQNELNFLRRIVNDYNLERLLAMQAMPASGASGPGNGSHGALSYPQDGHSADGSFVLPASRNGAAAENSNARSFVEDMHARSKPSANYDQGDSLGNEVSEMSFAMTTGGRRSSLERPFSHRNMSVLASHDPLAVSAVRTINSVNLEHLLLAERSRREYQRLDLEDRYLISFFQSDVDREAVYGVDNTGLVTYDRIL